MNQKSKKFQTRMLTCIVLVVFCLIVIAIFAYSYISRYESKKLDIKSRYTFSIDVDSNVTGYSNEDMTELAKAWLNKYVNQYRQRFVSYSMSVKKYGIDSVTMLDSDNNTVLLSFWVVPQDTESDYFSSWDGIMDNGVLKCEWVVSFYLDDNFNDTGTLYVTSVLSSEDYGLKQYYANLGIDSGGDTEVTTNSNKDQLANYVVRDNSLYITYDGGEKYVTVPASYSYLLYEDNSTTSLIVRKCRLRLFIPMIKVKTGLHVSLITYIMQIIIMLNFLMLIMVLLYAVTLKVMIPMNHPEYIKHLTAEKAGKQ